jgi:hypothetical protein
VQEALQDNTPLVLDLTALLTVFFVYNDAGVLEKIPNPKIVSQSTIDELQQCYEELERSAADGQFSMGYEDGQMIGHKISKEVVQGHRQKVQDIISWCSQHATIMSSGKNPGNKKRRKT